MPARKSSGAIRKGSAQDTLALELGKLTGTEMVGVPYKGGADALNDVLAGLVQMYVSSTLAVLPPWKAGRVRLLAVSSPERSPPRRKSDPTKILARPTSRP